MDIINDRYEVTRTLGRGQHARVVLAWDRQRRRSVALKIFTAGAFGMSAEAWAKREFEKLQPLRHPGLVRVLAFEIDPLTGHPFNVQEVIEGDPFFDALSDQPLADVVDHVISLLRVLEFIHSQNLVHGDLRPDHVLVTRKHGVVVLDPLLPPPPTRGQRRPIFGSLGYQAPEVLKRLRCDERSDLYAVGVLLYQVITGHHPFPASNPVDVIRHQLLGDPVPPSTLHAGVPSELSEICLKLLSEDADLRYQTAADVIDDLRRRLAEAPVARITESRVSALLDPPLVGRDAEIGLIRDALLNTMNPGERESPKSLIFEGPRGIGKSRLQAEAIRLAAGTGFRILHAPEPNADPVLGPFAEWLDELRPPDHHSFLSPFLNRYLRGQGIHEDLENSQRTQEELIAETVSTFFNSLPRRPVLVAVPELQRLPDLAFEILVQILAPVDHNRRLVVLGSFDHEEMVSTRRHQIQQLREEELLEIHPLNPLTEADIENLVHEIFGHSTWGAELASRLEKSTGGNLSGILESLRVLVEQGEIVRDGQSWQAGSRSLHAIPLPEGLRNAVTRRLDLLSPESRQIVDVLGLLERSSNSAELGGILGLSPAGARAALDELRQRGFVRSSTGGRGVILASHIAETVALTYPRQRKRKGHRNILRYLEARRVKEPDEVPDLVELATHAIGADDADSVAQYAEAASNRATERLDYLRALELIEEAVPSAKDDPHRARLLLRKGSLEFITGWLLPSRRSLEAARQIAAHLKDRGLEAQAWRGLAQTHLEMGDLSHAERAMQEAKASAEYLADSDPLLITSQFARLALDQGKHKDAREHLLQGIREIRRTGSSDAAARVLVYLSRMHREQGRLRRALNVLRRCEKVCDMTKPGPTVSLVKFEEANVLRRLGRLDDVEKRLLEILTSTRQSAERSYVMEAYRQLGLVYAARGAGTQATAWLDRSRTLAVISGQKLREAEAEFGLGMVKLRGHNPSEAEAHLEHAASLHAQLNRPMDGASCRIVQAEAASKFGHYERALDYLDALDTDLSEALDATVLRPWAQWIRGRVYRRLGRFDEAESVLRQAIRLLRGRDEAELRVATMAELGWVHIDQGVYGDAEARLSRALELCQDSEFFDIDVEALGGLGTVALMRGDRETALAFGRRLLQMGDSPARSAPLARGHYLVAEALRGPPPDPDLEGHLADAVLLAESAGDLELLREILHGTARLREEAGQEVEAFKLYDRAKGIAAEIADRLTHSEYRARYLTSGSRDRIERATGILQARLRQEEPTRVEGGVSDQEVFLDSLARLTQTRSAEECLRRATEVMLQLLDMPIGFGVLAEGGVATALVGTGLTEKETLGSSRLESTLHILRRGLMTGEVLICADVLKSADYRGIAHANAYSIRSFIALPLRTQSRPGRVLGALFVAHRTPLAFGQLPATRRLTTLTQGIAGHLSTLLTVGNLSQARSALNAEKRTLKVLRNTAEAMGRSSDLDTRIHETLDIVRRALGVRKLAVVDLADEPGRVRWVRERPQLQDPHPTLVSRGVIDTMLASGRPVCVDDVSTCPPFSSFKSVHDMHIKSVCACPVKVRGDIVAAVYADQGEDDSQTLHAESTTDFLEAFARQVGLAFERERLDQELDRSRQQIESILESAPYPVVAVNAKFVFQSWNRAAEEATHWRREEVVGQRMAEFLLSPRYRGRQRLRLLAILRRLLKRQKTLATELWLRGADGDEFLAAVTAHAMISHQGATIGYTSIVRDLTKERNAAATIRRFEHIIDQVNEGVALLNADGQVTFANRALEELFGYDREEIKNKSVQILFRDGAPLAAHAINPNQVPWKGETVGRRKDGSSLPVALSVSSFRDESGAPIANVAVISDVSQRKRHEDELRRLSDSIISAQEEERRRLARELHDESGQALAALKFNLEFINSRLPKESSEAKELLKDSSDILARTQSEFRRMAADLHPAVLETFGLRAALKRYVTEVAKSSGLEITMDRTSAAIASRPVATALYRMAQEALTNIVRHASAQRVRIRLERRGQSAVLVVADDGQGFETDSGTLASGIGLIGMRERASTLGGRLTIRSLPKRGTVVRAWIPLPHDGGPGPEESAGQREEESVSRKEGPEFVSFDVEREVRR